MMTLHFLSLLTITSFTRFFQAEKMAASRIGVVRWLHACSLSRLLSQPSAIFSRRFVGLSLVWVHFRVAF